MGAARSLMAAVRDVERVQTASPEGVRNILDRMACRASFMLIIYAGFFVLYLAVFDELRLQCLGTSQWCIRDYTYIVVYGLFFLSMTADFCLAFVTKSGSIAAPQVASVTNVS